MSTSDHSSVLRKRVLRLSREQHAAYNTLHEQVPTEIPGLTRHQARGCLFILLNLAAASGVRGDRWKRVVWFRTTYAPGSGPGPSGGG